MFMMIFLMMLSSIRSYLTLPYLSTLDMIRIRRTCHRFNEYSRNGHIWGYRLNQLDEEKYIPRGSEEEVLLNITLRCMILRTSMQPHIQPKPKLEYYTNMDGDDGDIVHEILE